VTVSTASGSAPRIALIVDHPLRDLAGLVLVAEELCQRGAVCHLVPMNLQDSEIWALRPDFVLLNFLRRGSNEGFARRLVRARIRFGLLDTEGGVWPSEADYAETLWEDRALLHAARRACMWGPRLAGHLVSTGLLDSQQVRVTGCARFDLYHPRWRGLLGADDARDSRPRILMNTNYYTANGRFVTSEENRAQLEKMGWSAARAHATVETEAAALRDMIALAGDLARRFPRAQIVVRPHPFENPDRYKDGLRGFANLEINETGPVQPQLGRAAAVIQRSCTTAIEATLASVPALSPRWISAANENPMSEEVSVPCETQDELARTITEILDGRHVASPALAARRREVLKDWFFESDGMAHRRVAQAVGECLGAGAPPDADLCRRFLYGVGNGDGVGIPLGSRLRHALRLSPHWSFAKWAPVVPLPRPEKAFGAPEVEALIRRVAELKARAGERSRSISVMQTRVSGDYSDGFLGHSVALRVS
jgi:surface carbohydrate biosynthesis protein